MPNSAFSIIILNKIVWKERKRKKNAVGTRHTLLSCLSYSVLPSISNFLYHKSYYQLLLTTYYLLLQTSINLTPFPPPSSPSPFSLLQPNQHLLSFVFFVYDFQFLNKQKWRAEILKRIEMATTIITLITHLNLLHLSIIFIHLKDNGLLGWFP